MITNESTFVVFDDQDSEQKPVRFIDFPGHRRLRPVLFANLEDCRAVIVVIDACTFSHQGVLSARQFSFSVVMSLNRFMLLCSARNRRVDTRPLNINCAYEAWTKDVGAM